MELTFYEWVKLLSMLMVLPLAILLLLGFLLGYFRENEEARYLPLVENAVDEWHEEHAPPQAAGMERR